jgi:hypothetical protein
VEAQERRIRRALERATAHAAARPPDTERVLVEIAEASRQLDALLASWRPRCERPGREWCIAFRTQAASDLSAVEVLVGSVADVPWSTVAMLLQMVFEKIAKAVLARTDEAAFRATLMSHGAASRLLRAIKSQGRYVALRQGWREVLPVVSELERAQPALALGGGHLEYPWEETDRVRTPDELPVVARLQDPRTGTAPRLVRLARQLLLSFDELFG